MDTHSMETSMETGNDSTPVNHFTCLLEVWIPEFQSHSQNEELQGFPEKTEIVFHI